MSPVSQYRGLPSSDISVAVIVLVVFISLLAGACALFGLPIVT
jgi:hypothetical protein